MEPRLSRSIRDTYPSDDHQELLAAAEAVQELLAMPGWMVLTRILDAESSAELRKLEGGGTLEQVDYVRGHAYRNGLNAARDAASTLIEISDARSATQQQLASILSGGSTNGR